MTTVFAAFAAILPEPLILAVVFLLVGLLVTRLAFRDRPVAQFICQLTSFGGFTVMLIMAGVVPSTPTPTMDWTFT